MSEIDFLSLVSFSGYVVELVGVLIILIGLSSATIRYCRQYLGSPGSDNYSSFRRKIGSAMLIGLDFLIAGDIIRTVVVDNSLPDVAALGLVVVIRTVLVFTIHLEVEGRWPWQDKSI